MPVIIPQEKLVAPENLPASDLYMISELVHTLAQQQPEDYVTYDEATAGYRISNFDHCTLNGDWPVYVTTEVFVRALPDDGYQLLRIISETNDSALPLRPVFEQELAIWSQRAGTATERVNSAGITPEGTITNVGQAGVAKFYTEILYDKVINWAIDHDAYPVLTKNLIRVLAAKFNRFGNTVQTSTDIALTESGAAIVINDTINSWQQQQAHLVVQHNQFKIPAAMAHGLLQRQLRVLGKQELCSASLETTFANFANEDDLRLRLAEMLATELAENDANTDYPHQRTGVNYAIAGLNTSQVQLEAETTSLDRSGNKVIVENPLRPRPIVLANLLLLSQWYNYTNGM